MTDAELEAYVNATLALQGFTLDDERRARVVATFARNAEIARLVTGFDPGELTDPAPQFVP